MEDKNRTRTREIRHDSRRLPAGMPARPMGQAWRISSSGRGDPARRRMPVARRAEIAAACGQRKGDRKGAQGRHTGIAGGNR
jgi:hypothetical protein